MRLAQHHTTRKDHHRARELRNNASPAEQKLWIALRAEAAKQGIKFRRQAVLHPFIADFACMQARLLIELDGYSHDTQQGYDRMREEKLKKMGYYVMRFNNEDVDANLEGVVRVILDQAALSIQNQERTFIRSAPTPYPLPRGEGENL